MKQLIALFFIAVLVVVSACSQDVSGKNTGADESQNLENPDNLIWIKGGTVKNEKSSFYGKDVTVPDFYMGKYEVSQKEWLEVMGSNPSQFKGSHLPVESVSWYDAVEYCNKRSMKEGFNPYYNIDKNQKDPNNQSTNDPFKWTVTINQGANGYRLPTEAEWEYAAGGGQMSKSYLYSGDDNADEVAWYWKNAGDQYLSGDWNWPLIENNHNQTKTAGLKKPNELGLYDMSGNVREWCWSWYGGLDSGSFRVVKGGGWIGDVSSSEIAFQGKFEASGVGPDQGFRVCRDA